MPTIEEMDGSLQQCTRLFLKLRDTTCVAMYVNGRERATASTPAPPST